MNKATTHTILQYVDSIPIPPLPQVLIRLLLLSEEDRILMSDVASVVAQDPALAAHVLTVANSPPFSNGSAMRGLEQCLTAIGPRMLRTLATSIVVQNAFAPCIDADFDYLRFWRHSLEVAELARSLAMTINYPDAEEAYLAGLLHDIGQLLLVCGVAEGHGLGELSPEGTVPTGSLDAIDPAVAGSRLVEQ